MNICHLVFVADSLTYTIAKALTYGGHNVFVWIVAPDYARAHPNKIQERLRNTPGVWMVSRDERGLPPILDRLMVQVFPRPLESLRDFDALAPRTAKITLISAGDRSKTWRTAMKLQWLELRATGLHLAKMDRIVYKDGFYRTDLYRFLKCRQVTGFDVHSQFLHSEQAFGKIHTCNWKPETPRPILANFLGSQDPAERTRILDSVRPLFLQGGCASLAGRRGKRMHWTEYSDSAPVGLGATEFLDILKDSDFTLCPRGYSLVTHRPLEALLKGSIPVLAAGELDLYDYGLEDRRNCIAVKGETWRDTVAALVDVDDNEVTGMRQNIYAMRDDKLCYKAAAERMRGRLGLAS